MRNLSLLLLLSIFTLSCNQGPKHPQAEIINQKAPLTLTAQEIVQYADSIDNALGRLDKSASLVYVLGEHSFYIERYSLNGKPAMMVKQTRNAGLGASTDRYYFKNDSLMLIRRIAGITENRHKSLINKRIYLRNNIPFKEDVRTAATQEELNKLPFKEYRNATPATSNYGDSINVMNDALAESDKFEMIFDQYISSETGSFLLLKSKLPGGYTASIRVKEKDAFIDSLETDPSIFKDAKLRFNWNLTNHEATYVPVKVTSAKGLNK